MQASVTGSTADFGSASRGSNPLPASKEHLVPQKIQFYGGSAMCDECRRGFRVGKLDKCDFNIANKVITLYSVDIHAIDLMATPKVTNTAFYFSDVNDAAKLLEILQKAHHISSFRLESEDSGLSFNPFDDDLKEVEE